MIDFEFDVNYNGTKWGAKYSTEDDVLYLREEELLTYAEEDRNGLLLLVGILDGELIGITVVNFWKRFGSENVPDSLFIFVDFVQKWLDKWDLENG